MSVLLLHTPMASPRVSNLAIEILAAQLRLQGVSADTFYATLRFPRTSRIEAFIHSAGGEIIFTPLLFRQQTPAAMVRRFLTCERGMGELSGNFVHLFRCTPPSCDEIAAELQSHIQHAERWLERCLQEIPRGRYAVYGFSVGFDAQRVSSLALARRLKEREPGCRILFGGTAVDGVMGEEIIKAFPCVDAISQGDADWRIVRLMEALTNHNSLDGIPGVLFRRGGQLVNTGYAIPGEDLDDVPVPDYRSFLDQLAVSEWGDESPILLFELSRGCWWGEKHHCRFCGLRADGLHFRRKSPARAAHEIELLAHNYPQHRILYATDAILDFRATRDLLPTLAGLRKRTKFELFFEMKSNASRSQVALLSKAGVTIVQPGIESFSDRVLTLMDKGGTAQKNVELLKSFAAHQIGPMFNLIIGTPGERAKDYQEMLELLPRLHHLPPPAQVCRLQLDRFSPYFRSPESWGLNRIEPEDVYRIIYQNSSINLHNLAYRFNYASAEQSDEALQVVWAQIEAATEAWRLAYKSTALCWHDMGSHIYIFEKLNGLIARYVLAGPSADLYRLCDRGATFSRLAQAVQGVTSVVLMSCLERWRQRGWVFCFRSGVYLGLASELKPTEDAQSYVEAEIETRPLIPLVQLSGSHAPKGV